MLEQSLGKSFSKILVLSSVRDEIVLGAQILNMEDFRLGIERWEQ